MPYTADLSFFLLLGAIAFGPPPGAPRIEAGFHNRAISVGASKYAYQVYAPPGWTKQKKWPVILFLHGAGERGSDNIAQTQVGIGSAIKREQKGVPFIVVLPQCPANRWWPELEMQALALAALDEAMSEFNGDARRIYLTGISMGGYGAWAIGRNNPRRFAAIAPVCGGVRPPGRVPIPPGILDSGGDADPYAAVAKKIRKIPAWVFHGDADTVVPVTESRKMVEALKAAGGSVRYSEYKGVGHNSWDNAYSEPDFFSWLLGQRLASAKRD